MSREVEVGLYGKLPSHGDFLRRRLPQDFVSRWDEWLQEAVAASRRVLGDRWLDAYLTGPVWRFALSAGVCGSQPIAGVLAPSVDRVGRYFPLTLAFAAPGDMQALDVALRFHRWYTHAERLVIEALAQEHVDFAEFDCRVMDLAADLELQQSGPTLKLSDDQATALVSGQAQYWRVPLATASALETTAALLLGAQLSRSHRPLALWWTEGSSVVEPSWLITPGLPLPESFGAMLDGTWSVAEWSAVEITPGTVVDTWTGPIPAPRLVFASAGFTDAGPVRESNQDAYLERPDIGLWVVADGMGGLSHGEYASRMVCDALAELTATVTLDELIESASIRLEEVNAHLRYVASRPVHAVQSGSTVAILLLRSSECAVLWAGDSRIYRLRDGELQQLTRDHSWEQPGTPTDGAPLGLPVDDSHAITRAVGGEDAFVLDVRRSDVRPGDRFLLCTDGLTRVLGPEEIATAVRSAQPDLTAAALVRCSLDRGTTDNSTAVVVVCELAPDDEDSAAFVDTIVR